MKNIKKIALLATILSFTGQSISAEAGDQCDPKNFNPEAKINSQLDMVNVDFFTCVDSLSAVSTKTVTRDSGNRYNIQFSNVILNSVTYEEFKLRKNREHLFSKSNFKTNIKELDITFNLDGLVRVFKFDLTTKGQEKTVSDITGAWYDPILSGLGFNFILAQNGLFAYYYGYDKNGDRLWLLSDVIKTDLTKNKSIQLKMYKGAEYNGANFTTKPVTGSGITSWGEMELNISSCTNATARLTGDDGIVIFNLEKLANARAVTCYD